MKYAIYDPDHEFLGFAEFVTDHLGKNQRIFHACINSLAKQALCLKLPVSVFGQEIDTKIVDFIQNAFESKSRNALDFYMQPVNLKS